MTIEHDSNQIIIRLPNTVDVDHLQQVINYLMYLEATSGSQAEQEEVDALAQEVNKGWWDRNKHRFSKE